MKRRWMGLFAAGLLGAGSALAQAPWMYTGELSAFWGPELLEGSGSLGLYQGMGQFGYGGELEARVNDEDEESFSSLAVAGFSPGPFRLALGAGFGQVDEANGVNPQLVARVTWMINWHHEVQAGWRRDVDGAGDGCELRWKGYFPINTRLGGDVDIGGGFYREAKDDLDGFVGLSVQPFFDAEQLRLGIGIALDEDYIRPGLLVRARF